jgi:uncharacterized membrane protein YczE
VSRRTLVALGAGLLALCAWWAVNRAMDLAAVSVVHWPFLLPRLVMEAVPLLLASLLGGALVLGSRTAKPLAVLFAVTVVQGITIRLAVPEVTRQYRTTLEQSRALFSIPIPPEPPRDDRR